MGINDLPLRELQFAGKVYQTGKPVRVPYREERLWKPTKNDPAGEFIVLAEQDETPDGYLRFRRPIVMEWGAPRGPNSWAWQIRRQMGGKRGTELTRRLLRARYDGIITIRWDRPYQMVNLGAQEAEWFLDTPRINSILPVILADYGPSILEVAERIQDPDELLRCAEMAALFEAYLDENNLREGHSRLWSDWRRSTGGLLSEALCGLLATLNVVGAPKEGDDMSARQEGLDMPWLSELVDHHYAFAQVVFRVARIARLRLYRGVWEQNIAARHLRVVAREASSWSLSFDQAVQTGRPLGTSVPRERILSFPAMWPTASTSEIVVLGSQALRNVRLESRRARQTGRQTLWLTAAEEDWMRADVDRIVSAYGAGASS